MARKRIFRADQKVQRLSDGAVMSKVEALMDAWVEQTKELKLVMLLLDLTATVAHQEAEKKAAAEPKRQA